MAKTPLTSRDWVAYFNANASTVAAETKPPALRDIHEAAYAAIKKSLPAWQLGETSDGSHLRAFARRYGEKHHDPAFAVAVEMFIQEEQRHGASLGEWLDLAGIPRRRRDPGDVIFRFCRHVVPDYTTAVRILVMVESLAEVYYSSLRWLTMCPRLQAECDRILRDEVRHIQFHCEHLALVASRTPQWLRAVLRGGEWLFYVTLCTAVWITHGQLMRLVGISRTDFVNAVGIKYRVMRRMADPQHYDFPEPVPRKRHEFVNAVTCRGVK